MSPRFWVLAAVFHTALIVVCALRGRAWLRRDLAAVGRGGFWKAFAVDVVCFGVTALVLGVVLAGGLPDPPFAVIRFWSQALFAEAPLFLLFLSVLCWRRRQLRRSLVLAVATLALMAVYVDAYHVEPYRLQVEEHALDLGPVEKGPTRTVRLLHLSDIQTNRVGDYERRVARTAAALQPDLVVLTGDYVHRRLRPGREATARALSDLLAREGPRPPLGTWAVGGDTDGPAIEARFREQGVRWLDDEAVAVPLSGGRSVILVGLAPATSRDPRDQTLRRLLAGAARDSPRIVFGHSPDFVLGLADGPRVDLALAGHTHGGQVVLPFLGPLLTLSRVPRHVAAGGLHHVGDVAVHVSRGVGMERGSAPQIRFLCPPGICVLTLRLSGSGRTQTGSSQPAR